MGTIATAARRVSPGQELTRTKRRSLLRTLDTLITVGLIKLTTRGYRATRRQPSTVATRLGIPAAVTRMREAHRRERVAWLEHLATRRGPEHPTGEQVRSLDEAA